MSKAVIHSVPGLVEVTFRDDLKAVYLKWFSEYDEASGVKDAVFAALDYARREGVQNWLADISTSQRGLTAVDQAWVSGDQFRDAIVASPLRRFVLIPPLPETGQDISWLADWEANTLGKFGDEVEAKLASDPEEIRAFFLS